MNSSEWAADLNKALPIIPNLIIAVEQAFPANGNGADKLAAVVSAVAPLIPADKLPVVGPYVSALVALYNLVGFFKKQGPVSAPTSVPAVSAAAIVGVNG